MFNVEKLVIFREATHLLNMHIVKAEAEIY